jgi:hypothetical protein
MKIGDMLKIKGETTFIRDIEEKDLCVKERTCDRWIPRDTIDEMIQSGEATLIPSKGE